MNKIKEAIQTTTEAMNLLYDTLSPMPKSAIMSKLSKIKLFLESLPDLTTELENKDEVLQKIKSWCEAYPLEVFPKPDLKKADEVLKAAGMTLDAISADTIRNVLDDVKDIVDRKGGGK